MNFKRLSLSLLALVYTTSAIASPSPSTDTPKPATPATERANATVRDAMSMNDRQDNEDATRGKLAELPDTIIRSADGRMVYDTGRFDFIRGDAPSTVNPSLWRQQVLNTAAGFFAVSDGVYQVRGYDMANMTLVETPNGWIVIDTLFTEEVARAGMRLAMDTLGSTKPVLAVIYTHSHADHFGGIRGVIDETEVRSGRVKLIAPEGFMEHAIAENVLAGNAMSRRANYMYGISLPAGETGSVGTALGLDLSIGSPGLIAPNHIITTTGEELVVDGVRMQFQMAQGSEAPSEFMIYFPDKKALCVSEVATRLMHNIYTIRGAKMRDALVWSKYLNETLDLFSDAEVAFASHHWPTWGNARIRDYLANQRDLYRFIHDRALHLANQGYVIDEIGDETFFPAGLAADASTRGYYGTLSHNLRAVYNFYLGYYDGNPATLHPLPPADSARRYVAAMGGEAAVVALGRQAFAEGDYRWVAELMNKTVFANPENKEARALQADALEQLGYQAESAPWRNAYLMGALELRTGPQAITVSSISADALQGMPNELLFDFIALRLDHTRTDGMQAAIQIELTDSDETWALELSNSVLNNARGRVLENPDLKLSLTRDAFVAMLMQGKTLAELAQAGQVEIEGDPAVLGAIVSRLAAFNPTFDIVTP